MRQLSREEKLMAAFKFNGLGEINARHSDLFLNLFIQILEILETIDTGDQENVAH
jgi:hypothetical protein